MGGGGHEIGSTLVWRPDAAGTADAFSAVDWCDPGQGGVAVADSFRIADCRVRGLPHHAERFVASLERAAGADAAAEARAFWRDSIAVLVDLAAREPTTPLFPRLERRERGELRLMLRPSPPIASTAVLATAAADPRRNPRTKGPDLERLAALRTAAQQSGADEAVITDARGRVIEGAYSALLIARAGRLSVVDDAAPRIPSVTERIVLDAARTAGRTVDHARPTPAELEGACVWVLSALHGARAVTAWVDGPHLVRDPTLDDWLAAELTDAAEQLTDAAPISTDPH